FQGVPSLGLEEDLVSILVGKTDDLVLNRRAVAWPSRLDLTGVHRRPVQIGPDDSVDLLVGVRDVAVELVLRDALGHEAERLRIEVARLRLEPVEIDGPAVESAGRAGLEAGQLEVAGSQAVAERLGRCVA